MKINSGILALLILIAFVLACGQTETERAVAEAQDRNLEEYRASKEHQQYIAELRMRDREEEVRTQDAMQAEQSLTSPEHPTLFISTGGSSFLEVSSQKEGDEPTQIWLDQDRGEIRATRTVLFSRDSSGPTLFQVDFFLDGSALVLPYPHLGFYEEGRIVFSQKRTLQAGDRVVLRSRLNSRTFILSFQ